MRKQLNLDQFGRYKGGLPQNKPTNIRGSAMGAPGTMHKTEDFDEQVDLDPEYTRIDQEKKESFQNFHQNEREARTMRWPWYTVEVDYDFFKFTEFRKKIWPPLRFMVFFLFILPTFARFFYERERLAAQQGICYITQLLETRKNDKNLHNES